MKAIKTGSVEFKNFKEAVERNKIKNTKTKIDMMMKILKKNNIRLSETV